MAEFALSAQICFFVGFSIIYFLFPLASSDYLFLPVASPYDDVKERVEERSREKNSEPRVARRERLLNWSLDENVC